MKPEQLTEILKNHRSTTARIAYLRSQLEMLERFMGLCKAEMVDDLVTMSQAITGMPHGSGTSDPTSRLAVDIASGEASQFIKQIQTEMEEVNKELRPLEMKAKIVDTALSALTERERKVLVLKIIDDLSWVEVLDRVNREYKTNYAKRSLQRLLSDSMTKAAQVVR